MNALEAYLTAIDFSQNALKSIIHRYKIQTFFDIDSIPISVAEDLFFKMQEENKVFSVQGIAYFCKYHTLHLATCDRKHKCQSLNPYADIQENPILYKKTAKSVSSLKKIELIKEMTLQGKKNEEIMRLTGFARSTVCYLQKQAGVKCVNSRIQYTKEQVEKIKRLSIDFTAKEVGEKLFLTERRVRAIAAQEKIHFYHIGGAPKREKIKNEDDILELFSQGMSGLQIAKRLGISLTTVYKVKQRHWQQKCRKINRTLSGLYLIHEKKYSGYGYHGGGRKATGIKRVAICISGQPEQIAKLKKMAAQEEKTVSAFTFEKTGIL